ncbi:helix-turn-helix transcriptional regulator [Acidovorax sp. RAC01]|uniref:helix-turn-helix transcriptional regulator n=1 Tax=Acidovorax sp. RAC01 TaxID=1842533 RepID=UPI0018D4D6F1|nr:AlpA family phage regulatory protein [Acidovorax sp. RAC01]
MVCVSSSLGSRNSVPLSVGSALAVRVPASALPVGKDVEALPDAASAASCENCPHAEHDGQRSRLTSLLRVSEVAKILGISRSTIYAQLQQRGDQPHSDFPRPIRLNAGPRSSVRWRADDVQAWIDSRQRAP